MSEEQDMSEDDDLEGAYEGEVPGCETCLMCSADGDNVPRGDRWVFTIVDRETGEEHPDWICRECHGKFQSVEEFNEFRTNGLNARLYRAASQLRHLVLLKAPPAVLAHAIFSTIGRAMFIPDEFGGSEKVRSVAHDALRELSEKICRKNPNP